MKTEKLRAQQAVENSMRSRKNALTRPAATRDGRGVAATDSSGRSSPKVPASRRVPAKWRWQYDVLLSLQNRLLRERGELRRAAAEPLEPHSLNEADSATDEFDHNVALTQLSAEQNALYEVDAALHRIVAGTYGVCEESGKRIPAARLRVIPWTRFTREVEERLENNGTVGKARLREAATVRDGGRPWFAQVVEAEEAAETSANDETLSPVLPPAGQPAGPHTTVLGPLKARKRKEESP